MHSARKYSQRKRKFFILRCTRRVLQSIIKINGDKSDKGENDMAMAKKILLLGCFSILLLLCSLPKLCSAREYRDEDWIRTVYNEDNGLPTGEANAIVQTSDGYIWIGSYGGLIRYDGTEFLNFSAQKKLNSSSIRALYEGKDGKLYVGTNDKGVYLYVDGVFSHIGDVDGENSFYSVRSFAEISDGTVYVGTSSGLARIEDGKLIAVPDTQGKIIYDLTCDVQDRIWACADDGQILIVCGGTVCAEVDDSAWLKDECYCVLAAADGSVYLGSSTNEVACVELLDDQYGKDSFAGKRMSTGQLQTINRLYEDAEGRIWVLAGNGMGYLSEDGSVSIPSAMRNQASVSAVMQDYEGSLWTASTKMGVSYYSHGKYWNFNEAGGLDGVVVNAVLRCGEICYIGTDSGLVVLGPDFSREENELTKVTAGKRVRHITYGDDGTLWLCLYGDGLLRYGTKDGSTRLYTTRDGLLSNQVRQTLFLSDGTLAVAGTDGINLLKDGEAVKSYGGKELPYPFILCMYELKDGTLLAGSDGMGIYAIRGDKVEQFYREEGLESGVVMRMVQDPRSGEVWISAGDALYLWDSDGIRRVMFENGSGSVFDIFLVGEKLWLMKSNGPVVVDKNVLYEGEGEERELSKKCGLTGTLVANSWNDLSEDGNLWLCTNNGVSVIPTEDIPVNSTAPKGAVTRVTVDGEAIPVTEEIRLPASAKRITLNFAVMSYTLGEKSVEYRLEGFDEELVQSSFSDFSGISYTNLTGGDYVFRMTVFNEDGVKGSDCVIRIHKDYHFWELAWVKVMLVLVLIVLISGAFQMVYRMKIRSLKKRQAEYQSIIEQSLSTFANAIDAKDKDTNGHSGRVAVYAREIARRMKLSDSEQETVYYTALLHDIGKIGIPDSILKKSGKLTEEEWTVVRSHPVIGGEILREFTAIPGISDGAKYHHEFYNGKGYCEGLKGEEIPLQARIIAVADAFDAMCSTRYYHSGNTAAYAREEILRCSGTQFDPKAADCMIKMIDEGFMETYNCFMRKR